MEVNLVEFEKGVGANDSKAELRETFGWGEMPEIGDFEDVEEERDKEAVSGLYKELGKIAGADDFDEEDFEEDDFDEDAIDEEGDEENKAEEDGKARFLGEMEVLDQEMEELTRDVDAAIKEAKEMIKDAEEVKDKQGRRREFERLMAETQEKARMAYQGYREWYEQAVAEIDALRKIGAEKFGNDETEVHFKRLEGLVADGSRVLYGIEKGNEEFDDVAARGRRQEVLEGMEAEIYKEVGKKLDGALAERKADVRRINEAYEAYRRAFYLAKQSEEEIMAGLRRLRRWS